MRTTPSRGFRVAVVLAAIVVRIAILAISGGRGEMEGLSHRYVDGAYALAAGYGLVRPAEDAPAQYDLSRLADSLAARGERLDPRRAPAITPSRWRPSSDHPPGYPLLLLLLYRVLGPPLLNWAVALQILADALACLLVLDLGRRLAGEGAGRIAAFGVALFPPIAYLAVSRVADAWAPSLFVLASWLLVRALGSRRLPVWVACGAACGVLALFRPDFLLAPVAFAAVALAGGSWRRRVPGIVAMLVAFGLVMTPWTLRNGRVLGRFTPGTTAAGMTLLQSVGQFPNDHGIGALDSWYADEAHRHGFDGVYDPRADALFRDRYEDILRSDPVLIAKGVLRRLAISLVPPYHWGYANPAYAGHSFYDYVHEEGLGPAAALRRHPGEIVRAYWDRFALVPFSLLLVASCLGMAWLARRRWRGVLLLLAPWLYVVAIHLPFFLTTRMLVPGLFAQWIALGWCIERLRGRVDVIAEPGSREPASA